MSTPANYFKLIVIYQVDNLDLSLLAQLIIIFIKGNNVIDDAEGSPFVLH